MSKPTNSEGPATDVVPVELQAIIELFATALAKVSFPDVDAAVLRKHADDVRAAAREVDRARAGLATAEAALADRTGALAAAATRGLAYARVYAEAHPELAERLAAVVSPATNTEDPAPRKRGRPRKTPRPELPFQPEGLSAS